MDGTAGASGASGKRAVIVRDGEILLVAGSDETQIGKLVDVPLARGESAIAEAENVLAAVAAAWALGIPPALIQAGIVNFQAFEKA